MAAASQSGRAGLWYAALFGALLTAIYKTRATFLTFFGKPRYEGHPHDPPTRCGSRWSSWPSVPPSPGSSACPPPPGPAPASWSPVVGPATRPPRARPSVVLSVISVPVAGAGMLIAYLVYLSGRIDWLALRAPLRRAKRTLMRGFYVNDFYANVHRGPGQGGAAFLRLRVRPARHRRRASTALGRVVGGLAAVAGRRVQTGLVRNYALAFLLGAVGILLVPGGEVLTMKAGFPWLTVVTFVPLAGARRAGACSPGARPTSTACGPWWSRW